MILILIEHTWKSCILLLQIIDKASDLQKSVKKIWSRLSDLWTRRLCRIEWRKNHEAKGPLISRRDIKMNDLKEKRAQTKKEELYPDESQFERFGTDYLALDKNYKKFTNNFLFLKQLYYLSVRVLIITVSCIRVTSSFGSNKIWSETSPALSQKEIGFSNWLKPKEISIVPKGTCSDRDRTLRDWNTSNGDDAKVIEQYRSLTKRYQFILSQIFIDYSQSYIF